MKRRSALGLAALIGIAAAAAPTLPETRRSGFADMGRETQAMQLDDSQNPGMLWVQDGAALWSRPAGPSNPSCAGCHGDASRSMRGVAARYPGWDGVQSRPVNLAQRINLCRERHQKAPALGFESQDLLALEAFVAHASRGLPIAPPAEPALAEFRNRGEALWVQRIGQLDLACAQCHDERAGGRLGGSLIPQGRSLGYPIYRLEWQGLGSLQRRVRNCMGGVRAEPLAYGSPDLVALELYLAWRDRGMAVETPAVRP